ncbi:phage major capsid protein [Euzebya pacifica]|uniref:phage major capsid protein n=1 Tax=Euzebya pacifica TaxID=1608957 RepID=UPI0030FBF9A9
MSTLATIRERKTEVRQRLERIDQEMRTIHDKAGPEPLTGGDAQRWKNLEKGADRARAELQELNDEYLREMERGIANGDLTVEPGTDSRPRQPEQTRSAWTKPAGPQATLEELRGQARRAVELTPHATDDQRHAATLMVDRDEDGTAARWATVASDPAYLTAFRKVMADPTRGHLEWTEAERSAYGAARTLERAMSLTDGAGGYMVPFSLDPAIRLTSSGAINPLRGIANIKTIATDSWNGVTSSGVTASFAAEGAEVGDGSPTLVQPSFDVEKAHAFIPYSIEVGMDAVDFVAEMRRLFLDAKDVLEAEKFLTGAGPGSNEPTGLITQLAGGASEVDPGTGETFAIGDVYKTIEALPPRFRPRAHFLAELSTINAIRQFATANNYHAYLTDLGGGEPARLVGKPLHEASYLDAYSAINTGADADNHILVALDPSEFMIVDRVGATVEMIPHLFGSNRRPTGQRGLYFYWRTTCGLTTINAARVLNVATAA